MNKGPEEISLLQRKYQPKSKNKNKNKNTWTLSDLTSPRYSARFTLAGVFSPSGFPACHR
jgi:hypothetical protein